MKLNVYALPSLVPIEAKGPGVVIDVLRATSVIVTALANGARSVNAVAEVDTARSLQRNNPAGSVILGGERNALPIAGFDLGNSPLQYTKDIVMGKKIILTTTNGTKALAAMSHVKPLYIGSFLNGLAIAKALANLRQDAILICSGTRNQYTLDDLACAGHIAFHLSKLVPYLVLDDLAFSARFLYQEHRNNLKTLISHASHFSYLQSLGLEADIDYSLQVDVIDIVPQVIGEIISLDAP